MDSTTPGTREVRRLIVLASLGFAALLVAGAWLLLLARGVALRSVFDAGSIVERVGGGLAIGLAAGALCGWVVAGWRALERVRVLAREAIDGIEPRWHTLFAVAAGAGISEELFFRGALEPAAGPWVTALGFVTLHGAWRIRSRTGLAMAAFLFAASLGLSAVCAWRGLEAAMAAHAGYDLAVLYGLRGQVRREKRRSGVARGEGFD
jgi:membrane protease YdiL (CAAX protease family)